MLTAGLAVSLMVCEVFNTGHVSKQLRVLPKISLKSKEFYPELDYLVFG